MKKLLLFALLAIVCVIGFKAYNASQTNGKSFTYNVGKSGKEVTGVIIEKGTEVAKDGVEVAKEVADDLQEGIEDKK